MAVEPVRSFLIKLLENSKNLKKTNSQSVNFPLPRLEGTKGRGNNMPKYGG
jgi:hypothetical protein